MKKQYLVIGTLVVAVVIVGIVWSSNKSKEVVGPNSKDNVATQEEIEEAGDPADAVSSFYKKWLDSVLDPALSPYTSGVLDDSTLTAEVRTYIEDSKKEVTGVDPVLCQSSVPKRVGTKVSFSEDGRAEVLVLGRGLEVKSSQQAAVTVEVANGVWQITDIYCAADESAPEREFAFDNEGFLLKGVPPQLDPEYWYLVFEQNGQEGHTVPLFFDENSVCIAADESESVCDSSQFVNPSKARVQAGMTESGATVMRLQLLGE